MRAVRRLFLLGALSALVVVGFPSAGAQTPTVTSVIGAADGLFVSLDVNGDGNPDLSFGPTPSVTLPPEGGSVSDEVLGVNESVPPIALIADLLMAAAEGALGPDGFATAESTVEDIALVETAPAPRDVGAQQLEAPILVADLITATCAADLSGVTGSSTLAEATVLGESLEVEPEPNTEFAIAIDGIEVSGILNRQVENADGSLSVTALVLEIAIDTADLGVNGTLEVGPATCGVVEGVEPAPLEAVPAPAEAVPAQARFTG